MSRLKNRTEHDGKTVSVVQIDAEGSTSFCISCHKGMLYLRCDQTEDYSEALRIYHERVREFLCLDKTEEERQHTHII